MFSNSNPLAPAGLNRGGMGQASQPRGGANAWRQAMAQALQAPTVSIQEPVVTPEATMQEQFPRQEVSLLHALSKGGTEEPNPQGRRSSWEDPQLLSIVGGYGSGLGNFMRNAPQVFPNRKQEYDQYHKEQLAQIPQYMGPYK